MTTTTNTQGHAAPGTTHSIDEELKETSFGGWIAEHKSLTISAIVVIFLALVGYGIFDHFQTKKNNEYATKLFNFTENELVQFREGKIKAADLVTQYEALWSTMGGFEGAGSFNIEVIDTLMEKGNHQEAYALATKSMDKISNAYTDYFIGIRAAALAENLGNNQEALDILNRLISSSVKYMEDKIYLDLGRLQLKTGDKEKAKSSFQYVIDKGKEEEFKKMARLYMSEL